MIPHVAEVSRPFAPRAQRDGVRVVIGIGVRAAREEVPVVRPGVRRAAYAREPVCVVINVVCRAADGRLGEAVPHGVVCVVEVGSIVVVGGRQAIAPRSARSAARSGSYVYVMLWNCSCGGVMSVIREMKMSLTPA